MLWLWCISVQFSSASTTEGCVCARCASGSRVTRTKWINKHSLSEWQRTILFYEGTTLLPISFTYSLHYLSGILELAVVSAGGRGRPMDGGLLFLVQCLSCVWCLQHSFFLQCLGSVIPVTFPFSQLPLAPHQVVSQQITVKWDTFLDQLSPAPFQGASWWIQGQHLPANGVPEHIRDKKSLSSHHGAPSSAVYLLPLLLLCSLPSAFYYCSSC